MVCTTYVLVLGYDHASENIIYYQDDNYFTRHGAYGYGCYLDGTYQRVRS